MSELTNFPQPQSLAQLETAIRRDLQRLDYPKRDWLTPRQTADRQPILDVLIVGGGQGGLCVAFGLLREKVSNILVLDANPADAEGPWRTFARMVTLRTPKHLTGPDLGIPNLTIQAWYEAQHGPGSWEQVGLIPKEMWADYLKWYRGFLKIPVQNNAHVETIAWLATDNCFAVRISTPTGNETRYARKIVLATGIEGSGAWQTPAQIRENLPPTLYAHTHDAIDFEALRGKRVGVLGAGACAFDNAAVALETGAAEVHQFFRRKTLVRVNPYRWMEFVGFLKHHADLPDPERWRFILQVLRMGQLPPANTYARVVRFPNHFLHPDSPFTDVQSKGDGLCVTTPHGTFALDFLIVGTGFLTDLSLRPELTALMPHIALWSDRYTPPENEQNDELARHPYLGPHFEFQEKTPGSTPYLASVFNFTFGSLLSLGLGGASISGMKYGLPRLIAGITKQLYLEDSDRFYDSLCGYDVEDF